MTDALAGVVLAAGLGTRLRPLTLQRPKALCPVGGVPLADLALQRLEPFCGKGPGALAVNAHHHAEQVVAHIGGRAFVSVEQPEPLGTAGALGALHDWLDGRDVLLTNADSYLAGPLADLVDGWDRERCRLLVVDTGGPADFGTFRYVGACLLPREMVSGLPPEPSGLYEVLWKQQEAEGRLDLVPFSGKAIDCGTPADYLAANMDASGGQSVIGDGAVVDGSVERCVVWDGAYVAADEHLVEVIRAGTRENPLTVSAGAQP
ncbi:MAG TPA: sugar phosphate nucleotidyltransferase [Actinomycetales bacterium]|nr:sugar phosphate nucleotidyltransferase [Actinomycetales bacterium]